MAKMTRSMLKGIVKECLIEILSEGLADTPVQLTESLEQYERTPRAFHPASVQQETMRPRSASLDRQVINSNFKANIDRTVQAVTSNPILQDMLADTAKTTLQEVTAADPQRSGVVPMGPMNIPSSTAGPTIQGDPMQIFEQVSPGSSSKWAHLAFAPPKNHLPGTVGR